MLQPINIIFQRIIKDNLTFSIELYCPLANFTCPVDAESKLSFVGLQFINIHSREQLVQPMSKEIELTSDNNYQ